jgi:hypothetical protein
VGPVIDVKVMQTNQRVEALKKAGQKYSSPVVIAGLIDTGASLSALDTVIVRMLGVAPRGVVSVHTPSTGAAYVTCNSYDGSEVEDTQCSAGFMHGFSLAASRHRVS